MPQTNDLSFLKSLRTAQVLKNGVQAGILSREPDGSTEFSYLPTYQGPAIAFSLPLTPPTPSYRTAGGLNPFFTALLPEGHRLSRLKTAIKTSLDDGFSLLLAVGADLPGDIQVLPIEDFPSALSPEPALNITHTDFRFRDFMTQIDGVSIPGVQDKISASMITLPLRTTSGHGILKLTPQQYPALVENEFFHLVLAKNLNLPVTDSRLVKDACGETGLFVSRFDRILNNDDSLERLALEDATQILNIYPAQKYNVETHELINAVSAKAQAPLIAKRNLFIQFVYAWLMGNGDLHAKNISLLQEASGIWTISPIYDTVATVFYGDNSMALPILGKQKNLRGSDFLKLATEVRLPKKVAIDAMKKVHQLCASIDYSKFPLRDSVFRGGKRELDKRHHNFER